MMSGKRCTRQSGWTTKLRMVTTMDTANKVSQPTPMLSSVEFVLRRSTAQW